jgi:hypothetical protein
MEKGTRTKKGVIVKINGTKRWSFQRNTPKKGKDR